MDWINGDASWIALGLFLFLGGFVLAFFLRNRSAKRDDLGDVDKQSEESNIGIKNSRK